MNREEIKRYIIKEIKAFQKKARFKNGDFTHYIQGQIVGMVKAFKKMGMLEPTDQLSGEILDELF